MARGGEKMHNSGTRSSSFPSAHPPRARRPPRRGPLPAPTTPPGTAQTLPSLAPCESARAGPAGHSLWNCLAGARERCL